MRQVSMKVILGLAVLVLALSAGAFGQCSAGSQISLSISPATATAGDTVSIATGIHNTTSSAEFVKVNYTLKYAGIKTVAFMGSVSFPLAAGASLSESRSFTVPVFAPAGTYSISAKASAAGLSIGSCSAALTVVK